MPVVTVKQAARFGRALLLRDVPVYAHYGITHRCDLTCKMCGIWRYGNEKEELSTEEIGVVAQKMANLGVAQVALGGGEPFVRKDLPQIAEHFISRGIRLRVLTNGVNVSREELDAVLDVGVKDFSISLDSLSPKRFDHICEHEGSWEGAIRTMSYLAHRLHGSGGLGVLNCVVSDLNLEEIPDLVRFARDIGFAISLLPVELLAGPKDGVQNWEGRFIRHNPELDLHSADNSESGQTVAERVDRTYEKVIAMKREGWPVFNSTPYLEASREYLKRGSFPAEGCDAGRLYFSISPNGQFTICHRTQHNYKHILDPDFERYFNSDAYERVRMQEAGGCEGCMRACWIDTSSIFRNFGGFFDTVKLAIRPNRHAPLPVEEVLKRARHTPL